MTIPVKIQRNYFFSFKLVTVSQILNIKENIFPGTDIRLFFFKQVNKIHYLIQNAMFLFCLLSSSREACSKS